MLALEQIKRNKNFLMIFAYSPEGMNSFGPNPKVINQ